MDMGRWVWYQGKRAREEGMCVCVGGGRWAGGEATSSGVRCVGHTGWNPLILSDFKYYPQNVEARNSKVYLVNSSIDLFLNEIA